MQWYDHRFWVLILLLVLSGCGSPSRDSSNGQKAVLTVTTAIEKPRYPEIPFPSSAQAVQVEEIEGTRVIWFETPDLPATIYAFYADQLRASGWITTTSTLPSNGTDTQYFDYHNGPTNPAFQLAVDASLTGSTFTGVILNVTLLPLSLMGPTPAFDDLGKSREWRQAWPTVSIPRTMQSTPTPPLEIELAAAEQRWAVQAPRTYTVTTVVTTNGFNSPTECTTVLSVQNDATEIRSHDPCPWWNPTDSTIPNLFMLLNNPGSLLTYTTTPNACVSAVFDPVYGYPTFISLNCPTTADDGLKIDIRMTVE